MDNKHYPKECYNKNGSLVDPGAGYRLLEIGEKLLETDELFALPEKCWVFTEMAGEKLRKFDDCYRRKIDPALATKLDTANRIVLDLMDGIKAAYEVQEETGVSVERSEEIFKYYQELLKERG